MAKDVLKSQNIKRQHKVSRRYIYSYFEKGCRKNFASDNPER